MCWPKRRPHRQGTRHCAAPVEGFWQRLHELQGSRSPGIKLLENWVPPATGRTRRGRVGENHCVCGRQARFTSTEPNCEPCASGGPVSVAHQLERRQPRVLWRCYMQLCWWRAFRTLKGDLGLRPFTITNPSGSRRTCSCVPGLLPLDHLRQRLKACGGLNAARGLRETATSTVDVRVPTPTDGSCSWCAAPNRVGTWRCYWHD